MLAHGSSPPDSEGDLLAALADLRRSTLLVVSIAMLAAAWLWAMASMVANGILSERDLPALSLMMLAVAVLILRREHHALACWSLVLGLVGLQALLVAQHPDALIMTFGVVGVVIASALLGTGQSALVGMLLWAAGAGIVWRHGGIPLSQILVTLALFVAVSAAAWLTGRSLRLAVTWALTGWQRAQDMLQETRERRGELYRVLRALEEATYRIERMNSELILARAEAEEARATKARFVVTVSHEIRGPLNLILGFSRLMALSPERYTHALPADYRADVVAIYRNSQHLASLVDDILDMSQIEADRLPLIKERVDLEAEVITEALQIAEPLAERKGLRLSLDLHGALPPMLIDQVRIRQVLLNLLTNAVRFTETGSVTVRTRLEETRVVVGIEDTGPGIPRDELGQLFQAFRQLSSANRSDGKGSGLGLSISKQLVELHGGEIWAESALGVGTNVCFSLPLPGVAEGAISRPRRYAEGPSAHGKNLVLVIHQDPMMVKILGRYLEGYRVIGLPDEDELAGVIEELHPRAVIAASERAPMVWEILSASDYDVPLIECAIPRVMASAGAESGAEAALSYLVKPVSREMLSAVTSRVLPGGEVTILLVDDDPDALRLIEMMLLAIPQPYRILKALDGVQALQIMEIDVPDLAFVDLVIPGMGGEELIARMRRDPRLASVPVVIVSARDPSDEAISVGLPLSVRRQGPLSMGEAAQCLLTLLRQVPPRYLPDVEPSAPEPEPDPRLQSASPR